MNNAFLEEVYEHLEDQHVIVFVDGNQEQTKRAANALFGSLEHIVKERVGTLEVLTLDNTFLCVRRIIDQIPKIEEDPGYVVMFLPNMDD